MTAIAQVKAALTAIQGSTVSNERGLEVINAWASTVEPRMKNVIELQMIDEVETEVVTGQEVDPWTNEEAAQIWLDKMVGFNLRRVNEYRDSAKDAEQKTAVDALESEKKANRITKL